MEELIELLKRYNALRKSDRSGPYFLLFSQAGKIELVSFLPEERSYTETIGTTNSIKGASKKMAEIVGQIEKLKARKIDVNALLFQTED